MGSAMVMTHRSHRGILESHLQSDTPEHAAITKSAANVDIVKKKWYRTGTNLAYRPFSCRGIGNILIAVAKTDF
jgi:hypothetical protein